MLGPDYFETHKEDYPDQWKNRLLYGRLTNRLSKDRFEALLTLYELWIQSHETRAYRAYGESEEKQFFTTDYQGATIEKDSAHPASPRVIVRHETGYKWERCQLQEAMDDIINYLQRRQFATFDPEKLTGALLENCKNPDIAVFKKVSIEDDPTESELVFSNAFWTLFLQQLPRVSQDSLREPTSIIGVPNNDTMGIMQHYGMRPHSVFHLQTRANIPIPHNDIVLDYVKQRDHDILFHSTAASCVPRDLQQFSEIELPKVFQEFLELAQTQQLPLGTFHPGFQELLAENLEGYSSTQLLIKLVGSFPDYPIIIMAVDQQLIRIDGCKKAAHHHEEDDMSDRAQMIRSCSISTTETPFYRKLTFIHWSFLRYIKAEEKRSKDPIWASYIKETETQFDHLPRNSLLFTPYEKYDEEFSKFRETGIFPEVDSEDEG